MRELENTIERAVVLASGDVIRLEDVVSIGQDSAVDKIEAGFNFTKSPSDKILTVEELVNRYVQHVLQLNHGVKEKTARDLQIDRKTLYRRLREIEQQQMNLDADGASGASTSGVQLN